MYSMISYMSLPDSPFLLWVPDTFSFSLCAVLDCSRASVHFPSDLLCFSATAGRCVLSPSISSNRSVGKSSATFSFIKHAAQVGFLVLFSWSITSFFTLFLLKPGALALEPYFCASWRFVHPLSTLISYRHLSQHTLSPFFCPSLFPCRTSGDLLNPAL